MCLAVVTVCVVVVIGRIGMCLPVCIQYERAIARRRLGLLPLGGDPMGWEGAVPDRRLWVCDPALNGNLQVSSL